MKTRGFVISSMVMSILAAVFVWNQIIWSAVGVGIDSTALDEHRHGWNFSYIDTSDVEVRQSCIWTPHLFFFGGGGRVCHVLGTAHIYLRKIFKNCEVCFFDILAKSLVFFR